MRAILISLVLASGLHAGERGPEPVDRIVWERREVLPPANPEKVHLRIYTTARAGETLFTRLYQTGDVWQRRLEQLIYDAPEQELKAASLCDLNDDGVPELLLQFCPPKQQALTHLVVFSYGRRARRYVKIFEQGPSVNLRARWVTLSAPRNDLAERGLAIDELMPDGYTPAKTTTYSFKGERLHEYRR